MLSTKWNTSCWQRFQLPSEAVFSTGQTLPAKEKILVEKKLDNIKGWLDFPNWMFFWKTPKRPLTPPPSPFLEITLRFFFAKVCKYALTCVNLQWNFLDWRCSRPPLLPFLDIFSKIYDQNIPFWNQKNLQCNFLDRKWPPPPSEVFQKNIHFRESSHPLAAEVTSCWTGVFALCATGRSVCLSSH